MSIDYLAGFFDGEGSISICHSQHKSGRHSFQILVQVSNTNLGVLENYKELFGGSIHPLKRLKANHKQAYCWKVRSRLAFYFLTVVVDRLTIKHEQARLALSFQEKVMLHKSGKKLTSDEMVGKYAAMVSMKQLNGRFN